MQRKTFEIFCETDEEQLSFMQWCNDNHFDLITTYYAQFFNIVFDKESNNHNKSIILKRYLKGKNMTYKYENEKVEE